MVVTGALRSRGRSGLFAGGLALVLALALGMAVFSPLGGRASSHREAPLIAGDPEVDNTDVYAFVSPDKPNTVTLVGSWYPFEEPAGGPNFYQFEEGAHYDFYIDNDGDALEDVTYRIVFKTHIKNEDTFLYTTGPVTSLDDPNLNIVQTYDVLRKSEKGRWDRVVNDMIAAPSDNGRASMPNYAALRDEAIRSFHGGKSKVFAGQSDDPFFLDLRVFDLLYGGDFSEINDDTLKGFNVNTIALQVPKADLAKSRNASKNPIIGVWSETERQRTKVLLGNGQESSSGDYVNVSRLGNPLVNEVVIPLEDKDRWNRSDPRQDAQFLEYVNDPILARLINAVYGLPVPDSNPDKEGVQRDDLIAVFLTGVKDLNQPPNVRPAELMRLNMAIAPCEPANCKDYSRLGVIGGDLAGYPNGRRLADDVVDISLQVVEGELIGNPNDLSDAVDRNDKPFEDSFPYVALPHRGSDPDPH
jgi:hypothetical protein